MRRSGPGTPNVMQLRTQAAALAAAVLAVLAVAALVAYRAAAPRASSPTLMYSPPDPIDREVMTRIHAKDRLTDDVIAGRPSLLQAAAAFRDLDTLEPRMLTTWVLMAFPESSSLDEAYCRSVISYVKARAPHDRAEEAARGLEEELSARLRDGTLHLPEP